jgi:hypothetical protein
MTNLRSSLLSLALILILTPWTYAQSASEDSRLQKLEDYQEVSYEDLLTELTAKKSDLQAPKTSSFDETRIHAGIGYVNTFTNISAQQQNFNRYANGIQLSIGMDLFSPQWYSEGTFRNYGMTSTGTEEMTLKDIDLRVGYRQQLERIWDFTLSAGLSNRFLGFSDPSKSVSINENTPSLIVSTGFLAQVHKNISIGGEVGARSALVSKTADRNSFDLIFRLVTSL